MLPDHRVTRSPVNKAHPTDLALADYLDNRLSGDGRKSVESHLAVCSECRIKAVSAYESVSASGKRKGKLMGKINLYLIFAAVAFVLSFIVPRFFLQFLAATLLLGAKWVADSKSTRMLVMIHEAWKSGGEREASEVIKRLGAGAKMRL
ncbi:MAG: zf-HC2 domain-containing protein [Candidatus Omnitrophota bacterium]